MSDSVVYYLLFEDRIKIGYTCRFQARMCHLRPDTVLAVEPGGKELETHRHAQFQSDRIRYEMFNASEQLLAHITELRTHYPVPPMPPGKARFRSYKPPQRPKTAPATEPPELALVRVHSAVVEGLWRRSDPTAELMNAVRRAHQLGYPQAAIARRTGFHSNTIRNWCNG